MDRQQAEVILASYRPGTGDATDLVFAEALEQAKRDPVLGRWFEQQCALDGAIRTKLKQIAVPSGLAARILAGHKTVRPARWWRQPAWLAAAAAVLVLLTAVSALFFWSPSGTTLDAYRKDMVQFVTTGYQMNVKAGSLSELQQILMLKHWPADYVVPKRLEPVHLQGGGALTWQGHKVSMLCFDRVENQRLWLFVVDRAALADGPPSDMPRFARVGALATASWSIGNKTYLLAARGGQDFIRKYL